MAFNLRVNDNSGDMTPYLKFSAKSGRFFIKPEGGQDTEVRLPLRLAIDFDNAKSGWIWYAEGAGPQKVWDTDKGEAPRPQGGKFKRGFEIAVFGPDQVPGVGRLGLREWNSNAAITCNVIIAMHDLWQSFRVAKAGQVPVFVFPNVRQVRGAKDVNYELIFELTAWVDRAKVPGFPPLDRVPDGIGRHNEWATQPPAAPMPRDAGSFDPQTGEIAPRPFGADMQPKPAGGASPALDDRIPFAPW